MVLYLKGIARQRENDQAAAIATFQSIHKDDPTSPFAARAMFMVGFSQLLADRNMLLLQLQGFAACGDPEVRESVRASFARMWQAVADTTGLDPVTVKAFLAFGMLLNNGAALEVAELDEPWAQGVKTPIRAGLFAHITAENNQ